MRNEQAREAELVKPRAETREYVAPMIRRIGNVRDLVAGTGAQLPDGGLGIANGLDQE